MQSQPSKREQESVGTEPLGPAAEQQFQQHLCKMESCSINTDASCFKPDLSQAFETIATQIYFIFLIGLDQIFHNTYSSLFRFPPYKKGIQVELLSLVKMGVFISVLPSTTRSGQSTDILQWVHIVQTAVSTNRLTHLPSFCILRTLQVATIFHHCVGDNSMHITT